MKMVTIRRARRFLFKRIPLYCKMGRGDGNNDGLTFPAEE
jgi:hypothetical protein